MRLQQTTVLVRVDKGQSYTSIKKLNLFVDSLSTNNDVWKALLECSKSPKSLKAEELAAIKKISEECFIS